jgi:hypothetical protein
MQAASMSSQGSNQAIQDYSVSLSGKAFIFSFDTLLLAAHADSQE